MNPPNILIAGNVAFSSDQISQIQLLGFNVHFQTHESAPLEMDPALFEVVICNRLFDHLPISQFTNLRMIQLTSSGSDQLPLDALKQAGIEVLTAKGIYSIPIAEWVILKILELYKQSHTFYKQQDLHQWTKQRDLLELHGKTAAIVGYGDIGREITKRLHGFGVKTIGVGRRLIAAEYCDQYVLQGDVDQVLQNCDIVISTLPANEKTQNYFNVERLSCCKQGSIFINISRGAVLDETALLQLVESGHFRGAALDVFREEPLPSEHPLWACENILVTPHNSFVSEQNSTRLFSLIYDNLERFQLC